jgi:hypothetical protein
MKTALMMVKSGVRANPEAQRKNRDEGESRALG